MKYLLFYFVFLCCKLYGQTPIAGQEKIFFTNSVNGEVRGFNLNHSGIVCLKSKPKVMQYFPLPLDSEGKLFELTPTRQSGSELVFNDSIFIPVTEINYFVLRDFSNWSAYFFGILNISVTGIFIAFLPETAPLGGLAFVASVLYFNKIKPRKLYTKDWIINLQHSPEVLSDPMNSNYSNEWPGLFERYKKRETK